jgi:hypothetical protein
MLVVFSLQMIFLYLYSINRFQLSRSVFPTEDGLHKRSVV